MAFLLSLFQTVTFRNGYFSFDTPSRVANNLLSSFLFPSLSILLLARDDFSPDLFAPFTNSSYLCDRETISNDISSQFSAAKKL